MCSSPIPIHVLDRHVLDAYLFEEEGTADLDFVLCDVVANAASERERIVDYSWLNAATKPHFRLSDPIESRARALVRWIEHGYTEKSARELPELLRAYSKTMSFEYEVYLRNIVGEDGRRVEGVVQSVGSCGYLTLAIPLLLGEEARVGAQLSSVLEHYANLLQMRCAAPPQFSRVAFSLIITCRTDSRDAPVEVLSERVSMQPEEVNVPSAASFTSFIYSCVKLGRLPRYSSMLQRGASSLDYIPSLEQALRLSLREPLHFLEMVCSLSAVFGQPIGVNVATDDLADTSDEDALARCATFCIVDDATQFSFCICVRYHNGWTLPSVDIIANQYAGGISQGSPLRERLRYSEEMEWLAKSSSSEEFLDLSVLCDGIGRGSFATMEFLVSTCQ
ncbi:uncharacterized protein Tco025E_04316 [Trypanosoma conorhini]|uniref:Uncharacterized protein n=1 Tax=Trypanosoma conorhini TaxID=83891 RepID=A0A422PME9_9TRYP|nr:uncharacterized protein Tco025E_04316 [Trypanosoma conorhini]RNF18880.1 hypothetical protein Tco025E_04316 [Trypanosoma conorhini]